MLGARLSAPLLTESDKSRKHGSMKDSECVASLVLGKTDFVTEIHDLEDSHVIFMFST